VVAYTNPVTTKKKGNKIKDSSFHILWHSARIGAESNSGRVLAHLPFLELVNICRIVNIFNIEFKLTFMDVFKSIRRTLENVDGDVFHLHQGKLYDEPKPRDDFGSDFSLLIEPQIHSDNGGEKALLSLVSDYFLGPHNASSSIALSNGGTNALWLAFSVLTKSSSPIVQALSPYWMYLPGVINHSGGIMNEISTICGHKLLSEDEILASVKKAITKETSVIYIANPTNPVGNLFSPEFITRMTEYCESLDGYLVVDHAYYAFTCKDNPTGLIPLLDQAYIHPRIVNTFTFSKLLGVPGLRLGFLQGPKQIIDRVAALYRYSNYTPNSYSQSVIFEYLRNSNFLLGRQQKYKENLAIYQLIMSGIGPTPEGGFFSFIPLAEDISVQSLLQQGIGIVDGRLFGKDFDHWARICFTSESPDRLTFSLKKLLSIIKEK